MQLLEEARNLVVNNGYTAVTYEKLLELQNQAAGIEVSEIGFLIEEFLQAAPLSVLKEITKPPPKFRSSGWGL
jgi:hypothetical protein